MASATYFFYNLLKTKCMAKRQVPEVNAGSMADIAFLLLIFFLVTTTMDVDSGIVRKLPPWNPDQAEDDVKVRERNVYPVLINKHNQLAVRGELMDLSQLTEGVKEFILNPSNNEKMSEKKPVEVEYFGTIDQSKGVVSLQNDKGTEYGKYIEVQNEIVRAFNEIRDAYAKQRFGKKFDNLPEDQQEALRKLVPLSISEAEPKNIK